MKSVLCVLSEEQGPQFEASCLAQARCEDVRITFESNATDGLELVGLQKPDLLIVGMTIDATEGLEFLAMLMARYPDLSAKVVMLPELGDPFPPMIHARDRRTGRSSATPTDLAGVAELIRELSPAKRDVGESAPRAQPAVACAIASAPEASRP